MRSTRGGFILVLTLIVSALMFFFALAYLNNFIGERAITRQGENGLIAWEAASAGLAAAALQVKTTPAWTAGFSSVRLPASGATYSVTFSPTQGVPYSTNNASGTASIIGWGGRTVPAGTVHLVAVGTSGPSTQIEQALVAGSTTPFGFAMFASTQATLGGYTLIDAYNSNNGSYGTTIDPTGGNIGTNNTAAGKVSLAANSAVKGSVQVGVGGTAAVITGSGTYQSLKVPAQAWPAGAVSAPFKVGSKSFSVTGTSTLAPGKYRDITVGNNETLVLQAGTYVVRKLTMGTGARITVSSGPVNWYVNGAQAIGANDQINVGGRASDFNIIENGTHVTNVTLATGVTAAMTVYAPYSTLTINSGCEIYGSLLANTITTQTATSATPTKIHLDEALAKQALSFSILTQW